MTGFVYGVKPFKCRFIYFFIKNKIVKSGVQDYYLSGEFHYTTGQKYALKPGGASNSIRPEITYAAHDSYSVKQTKIVIFLSTIAE